MSESSSERLLQLSLHLDRASPCVYRAGDLITGKVRLECGYILSVKNLPGSCEAVVTGEHLFPFRIHLPASSPCSFTSTRGSVEFRLKTVLQLATGERRRTTQGFTVIRDLILGSQPEICNSLSCPPTSRNFISNFDFLKTGGSTSHLVNMVHQQTDLFNNTESSSSESDQDTSTVDTVPPYVSPRRQLTCGNDGSDKPCVLRRWLGRWFRGSFTDVNKLGAKRIQQQPVGVTQPPNDRHSSQNRTRQEVEQRSFTTKFKRLFTRSHANSSTVSELQNQSVKIHHSSDNPYLLPATWLSRSHTADFGNYPCSNLGAQTGYAVSCRLTASGSQLVPGESLTARLTLLVEDPFALILLPISPYRPCDLHWCARYSGAHANCSSRFWSPLAKAFVSYFLEDSMQKETRISSQQSQRIWWNGACKQPYRIFIVLRQLVTYKDWTNHVIAEEERDVYNGEMENKQHSPDQHLLRVVLEHVFIIPPLTPSRLEGTRCIDVSYTLGVVYYKLKRLQHLWLPNEWQVLNDGRHEQTVMRNVERLYIPNQIGFGAKRLKWSKRIMNQMQRTKHIDLLSGWRSYRELLLPIAITIGTEKSTNSLRFAQKTYHVANEMLYPIFYIQWPNSCSKGSLPPASVYYSGELGRRRTNRSLTGGFSRTPSNTRYSIIRLSEQQPMQKPFNLVQPRRWSSADRRYSTNVTENPPHQEEEDKPKYLEEKNKYSHPRISNAIVGCSKRMDYKDGNLIHVVDI
ncbi:hypothetical protein PHET_05060 [Paragonimus heterotremus]|uniref:Arrestin-like N-terminal domain-containing protein n=1 Tax=Paragonimus heterotremus TaxID=100268 RepID=A0A8J4X0D1_9TREM|nr:hypothetical protein PHET_05060 [Paragonimus heterotremus]